MTRQDDFHRTPDTWAVGATPSRLRPDFWRSLVRDAVEFAIFVAAVAAVVSLLAWISG